MDKLDIELAQKMAEECAEIVFYDNPKVTMSDPSPFGATGKYFVPFTFKDTSSPQVLVDCTFDPNNKTAEVEFSVFYMPGHPYYKFFCFLRQDVVVVHKM
jgi:hypothetical protein